MDGPLKVVETEEDQRTHGRGQLTVEKELESMKLSWSEAESKAQDRAEWRSIVGGLCSCRS